MRKTSNNTVDGRNPAPIQIYETLTKLGDFLRQLAQDKSTDQANNGNVLECIAGFAGQQVHNNRFSHSLQTVQGFLPRHSVEKAATEHPPWICCELISSFGKLWLETFQIWLTLGSIGTRLPAFTVKSCVSLAFSWTQRVPKNTDCRTVKPTACVPDRKATTCCLPKFAIALEPGLWTRASHVGVLPLQYPHYLSNLNDHEFWMGIIQSHCIHGICSVKKSCSERTDALWKRSHGFWIKLGNFRSLLDWSQPCPQDNRIG